MNADNMTRWTMNDLVGRVANMLTTSMTVEDIYSILTMSEGMSDYDAFLTYIGGKMIYESRVNGRANVLQSAPTIPNMRKIST